MTKLSLVFFIPLVLILIFRIATFSPVPIAEGCEIKDSWNLNRIENFSGLTDGLKSLETNTLQKTFINILIPFILVNSQIMVNLNCLDGNDSIIFNNLRSWKGKKQNSINAFYSETIDLFGDSVDITQEIYEDGGELVREVNVLSANTGKIKFFYREID